jgi:hypothetical protein
MSRRVQYGVVALAGVIGFIVGIFAASRGVPNWLLAVIGLTLIGVICFRQLARRDPVACASILAPAWIAALLAIPVADPVQSVLEFVSVGWLLVFILFGGRIWPTWSRVVLRRARSA